MHANSQNQPLPRQRIRNYWLLLRGDRPIGVLLLLWPTWWALWLAAQGTPPLHLLAIFTAGVWLTRSAGCVINDYADRWPDGQVKRTRERSEEHTSELQSLMRISYAVFCLKKKNNKHTHIHTH